VQWRAEYIARQPLGTGAQDQGREFNIDTGAEVTVISEAVWRDIGQPSLLPSDRTLRGPDTHVLPAQGKFTGKLRTGTQEAEEEIYVVKGLNKPLLGRPAITELIQW